MKKLFRTLTVLLLCALWLASTAAIAQTSFGHVVYYLLDVDGIHQLVRATLDGLQSPISETHQGSVIAYDIGADAAYVTRTPEAQLVLYLAPLDGSTPATSVITSARQVFDVVLTPNAVYINAEGLDGLPVLYGYDRALNLIMTRPVALSGAVQTLSPSAEWALATHPSGQFGVYALPSTERANFEMVANGLTQLSWSPIVDQLQVIGSDSSGTQPFLYLIDLDLATTRQFPLPSLLSGVTIQATWSDHGRYIEYAAATTSDRVLLTDVTTGIQTELAEPGFPIAPLSWSAGDEWLLYLIQIGTNTPELFAFNPMTGVRTPVRVPSAQIVSAAWSPDSAAIAAVTVGLNNTVTVYTALAPMFDVWIPLFTTDDGRFSQASLYWAGNALVFEHDSAALIAPAPTNTLVRLSPMLYPIVTDSIRVIAN